MELELRTKLAIYKHFATTAGRPSANDIAVSADATVAQVREAFSRLQAQRVLVLEADGESIRMAPPFSGIPTQHSVTVAGLSYFANCAWDAFGIPAALHQPATIHSRCEQSLEPLELEVSDRGPENSNWLFHCLVPASQWWNDIVFT